MRKVILTMSLAILAGLSFSAAAQNVSDLIISEIMPASDSSILDDYGRRNGWIEIYNKSQGTVNYAGCFFTDDRNNLKKSLIPKSDSRTKLGPRQVVVFYAGGDGSDGTFYTDFSLRPGSTVYLVSNDGRTIIDSLAIPAGLPRGKSVIKTASDIRQQDFKTSEEPAEPSPMIVNGAQNTESGSARLAHEDPYGVVLTIVSIGVVFSALLVLWQLFALLGKMMNRNGGNNGGKPAKKVSKKAGKGSGNIDPEVAAAISMAIAQELGGETYAAIATAMHLYLDDSVHDNESFVITIKQKPSQWNSRGRGFRQLPK